MAERAQLRVALDMTPAVVASTGMARHALALAEALVARPDLDIRGFAAGRGTGRTPIGRRWPVPLRVLQGLWRTTGYPLAEWMVGGADVVHSIGQIPPPTRRPLVVTIQDLLGVTHPEFYIPRAQAETRGQIDSLARASVVVTTCEATAREIQRHSDIPASRITIVPLGVRSAAYVRQRAPADPTLLFVGAITPRKGLEVLAEAVALLGPNSPPLLVVGPDGWWAEEVRARVRALDRHHRISFLGPLSDELVEAHLAAATIVCHPSLAEGFGMVCLEAMALGTPVVAADVPSVREMGGGVVRLVPPRDPAAMADAIAALLDDADERERLADAGVAHAAGFTWERTAAGVAEVYHRAATMAAAGEALG